MITLKPGDEVPTSTLTCEGPKKFMQATIDHIAAYLDEGWTVLIGNYPFLGSAAKYRGKQVRQLTYTNSRYHGKSVRTVWAIREALI